jgi:hypothetical protein
LAALDLNQAAPQAKESTSMHCLCNVVSGAALEKHL